MSIAAVRSLCLWCGHDVADISDARIARLLEMEAAQSGDVALGGEPGNDLEWLLHRVMLAGSETLARLAQQALERLLHHGNFAFPSRLFNDRELAELANALAVARAAGALQARLTIRDQAAKEAAKHGDVLESLREDAGDVPLISPEAAIRYFLGLVPQLGTDPQRMLDDLRRQAFTLAVGTDTELLGRVQGIIGDILQTGNGVRAGPSLIQQVLDAAGVTPANPQYSEMVLRTNYLDAANEGAQEEMRQPEIADIFPVWRYASIADERSRPWHAALNGNYYPSSVSFASVRDAYKGSFDGYNCRCTIIPISKYQWARLQANGARLAA